MLAAGLSLTGCGSSGDSESTDERSPQSSTSGAPTTVVPPDVDTTYDSVDAIREAVELGGFVCAEWEVHFSDDSFSEAESATCVGVLVFTVYEGAAPTGVPLAAGNDVTYDLVGPNWSVSCEDRGDICGALLPLLGGAVITSDSVDS